MLKQTKRLNVLLAVLVGVIIVTSLVMATMPKPENHVLVTPPVYHQDVVMLGVRASKFSGMAIHMDSPNVLLNKTDKLQLTTEQKIQLRSIRDRARQEALAVLTPEQQAQIAPIAQEPFVFDKLDRRIPTCSDAGGCGASAAEALPATPSCCPH